MSNRRRLRPHETARRDQRQAEAEAALRSGRVVFWEDIAPPGTQCSWCDCPLGPDSPHNRPGYVCPHTCPDRSAVVVWVLHFSQAPHPIPLCQRHHDGDFYDVLADRFPVEVMEPWADSDLDEDRQ